MSCELVYRTLLTWFNGGRDICKWTRLSHALRACTTYSFKHSFIPKSELGSGAFVQTTKFLEWITWETWIREKITTSLLEMEGNYVVHLRKAVKDCTDRGLYHASKWWMSNLSPLDSLCTVELTRNHILIIGRPSCYLLFHRRDDDGQNERTKRSIIM